MVVGNIDKRGRNKEKGRGFGLAKKKATFCLLFSFLLLCWFFSCLFILGNVFWSKFARFFLQFEDLYSLEFLKFRIEIVKYL